jgi:hypothetical protein
MSLSAASSAGFTIRCQRSAVERYVMANQHAPDLAGPNRCRTRNGDTSAHPAGTRSLAPLVPRNPLGAGPARPRPSHGELFQVHTRQLLVRTQPHPEVPGVTPASAPTIRERDHTLVQVSGVQLDRHGLDLVPASDP